MKRVFLMCVLFLFATAELQAANAPAGKETGSWGGEAELGYVQTSGNTDTTSINARIDLLKHHGPWKHEVEITALRSSDQGMTTADSVSARYRAQYGLTEIDYLFGSLRVEDNRFAGFDRRLTEVLGYGRTVIHTEAHTLSLEAGVGARQTDNVDGTQNDETIIRLALDYAWQITETSSFKENIFVEQGSDNRLTESVTELKLRINGNLSMKTTLTIKDNSHVPVGTENTDVTTAVTLVYDF